MRALSAVAVLSMLVAGCGNKTPEPSASEQPSSHASSASPPSSGHATGGAPTDVAFDKPAAWRDASTPGGMRKATYKIPKADGDAEEGEMSVVQAGGTIDQNVTRWEGQFEASPKAKRISRTVNGLHITLVEITGTFTGSGMPGAPAGAPKQGYSMLGAIVETQPLTFFKLTGPTKTVDAARSDFDGLVDGFRSK